MSEQFYIHGRLWILIRGDDDLQELLTLTTEDGQRALIIFTDDDLSSRYETGLLNAFKAQEVKSRKELLEHLWIAYLSGVPFVAFDPGRFTTLVKMTDLLEVLLDEPAILVESAD
ncbi:MAG: hypothetical protein QM703_13805 [Gemmatales bacterium]